jgi:2-amino-4-hydroxy-6-hydroxymethyldihydropteridine diphosphokinase
MDHVIYLSLGSNLGDRSQNLCKAISLLASKAHVTKQSSIYETAPWGYPDQPAFLNQVVIADTGLEPVELLAFLKEIELTSGRLETFRYGPRIIDLDILFYDDLVLDTPGLIIPHPHIVERAFVLIPLAEIAPNFRHPILDKSVQELKTSVDTGSVVLYHRTNPELES